MSSQAGPTYQDADLVLKLYDLRREVRLRRARRFMTTEFWPNSADEVFIIIRDFGSERNEWFRQATTYWEMACSLVNRNVIDRELFLDSGGEPVFIFAKLKPFMAKVRESGS